jgi:hypothetical protein
MEIDEQVLAAKFELLPHLDERSRRLVLGAGARWLGPRRIELVTRAGDVAQDSGGVRRGAGIEGDVFVITRLSRAMRSLKSLLTLADLPAGSQVRSTVSFSTSVLGTAYEFATGQRLASGDFEGGKTGAVKVLGKLGFTVQERRPAS